MNEDLKKYNQTIGEPSSEVLGVNKVPTVNIASIPPLSEGAPSPMQANAGKIASQMSESDVLQNVVPLPALIAKKELDTETKTVKIIWGDVFSGWILALATFLIIILILFFALVKSGLLALPLFSKVYNAPNPTRIVLAEPQTWNQFRENLTIRLQEKSLDGLVPIVLDVSEKDFTALLQGVVGQGLRSPDYTAEVAQVVFLQDKIEMYFFITWKNIFQAQILAEMLPVLHNDGTVELKISNAVIGNMPLPEDWSMQMIGYFFERDMGTWKIVLSNGYGIQDAIVADQSIKLFIGPLAP